jgi:hypothetical protein
MLDIPGAAVLDKLALIGGCLRLPLAVDAERLRAEVEALPASVWGTTGGRVGVHSKAEAAFLRGYAPAEGDKPIADRELLASLPYARSLIEALIPATPLRCLLARLPPGVSIAPHIDRAPYFSKSIRIHVPVVTHELAWMVAGSLCYLMRPGEVWALNNSGPHAVWNADAKLARTHLIRHAGCWTCWRAASAAPARRSPRWTSISRRWRDRVQRRPMIVTDRFVFLHLHKSGGTFVNECLLRFLPQARQIGYHLPRKLIPAEFASLPALGLVRNPWSYYVSWYTFQARRQQPNALFNLMSEGRTLEFNGTLRNLLQLGTTAKHLDDLVAALPPRYINRGLNLPGFALEPIRGSELGFYSYLYKYLYDGPGMLHVARMERMRAELPSLLVSTGQIVGPAMRAFITDEPPRNTSEHRSYTEYYDDSLRDLVLERDALVIKRHGYRFGD